MQPLSQLLVEMASLSPETGEPTDGVRVRIGTMSVELPIEGRLRDGELLTSAPRGRLATGFDVPLGRVRARFVVVSS